MTLEQNLTAAFQAVGADIKSANSRLAVLESGGNSAGVISTGPYTLDPLRAPEGSTVFLPAGDPVLTHIGNRWTGAPAGTTLSTQTQTASGSLTLATSGGPVYDASGSVSGRSVRLTASTTATTTNPQNFTLPAGVRSARFSLVTRLPRPTAGDHAIAGVAINGSDDLLIICSAGTDAADNRYAINSITAGPGWEASGMIAPTGTPIRIAITYDLSDTAGASYVRAALYQVHGDGTETQMGTTWQSNGLTYPAGAAITNFTWGKKSNFAGLEGQHLYLDSARVAHGPGAYPGLLLAEALYPEAV